MNDMTNGSNQLPLGIAGREDIIFGNILEIHEFHRKLVDFCLIHSKMCSFALCEHCQFFAVCSGSQVA